MEEKIIKTDRTPEDKIPKRRREGMEASTIHIHQGCRGQFKKVTEKPVEAGNDPGAVYYLYECDKCGKKVLVGGK